MNLYMRELRAHRNALVFWCIGMVMLIASGMGKYAAYSSSGQSAVELLKQFPRSLQILFGMNGFDLTRASGFYGVLFMFIALMATIHAVLLGSEIIAKEERDRTAEFLYTKPISRTAALTAKLLAGLTNLVILNLITLLFSIYFVQYFSKGESFTSTILVLMEGLGFLQLVFFSIGAGVAGISQKAKSASGIATSILLLAFFLMIIINFDTRLDFLKYLTPFKYFEALPIMNRGRLDALYIVLSASIITAMTFATYRFYRERDLKV